MIDLIGLGGIATVLRAEPGLADLVVVVTRADAEVVVEAEAEAEVLGGMFWVMLGVPLDAVP